VKTLQRDKTLRVTVHQDDKPTWQLAAAYADDQPMTEYHLHQADLQSTGSQATAWSAHAQDCALNQGRDAEYQKCERANQP
jgi:hypothetical protein